jgi:KDO2-lipid IV(A) lauroyltransferase
MTSAAEFEYSFRSGLFGREYKYRLAPNMLEWSGVNSSGKLSYADIRKVRIYRTRPLLLIRFDRTPGWRCALFTRTDRKIVLASHHYASFAIREDRRRSFVRFVNELVVRIAAQNPAVRWQNDLLRTRRLDALSGTGLIWLFAVMRRVGMDRSTAFFGSLLKTVGPWFPSHRLGRRNFAQAFPTASRAEAERVLRAAWENLGRTGAEFPHLEQMGDLESMLKGEGRIVVDEATRARAIRLREEGKSALFFSAHLANWELLAFGATALNVEAVVPARRPHNAAVNDLIANTRSGKSVTQLPGDRLMIFRMMAALEQGRHALMFVDQHVTYGGIDVVFFGRPCKVSRTLAWLARRFEYPIYGIRSIRLKDNRYRIEMTEPLDPPRDAQGKIDVVRTMQCITNIVEDWVREYPEQWWWFQRRWR